MNRMALTANATFPGRPGRGTVPQGGRAKMPILRKDGVRAIFRGQVNLHTYPANCPTARGWAMGPAGAAHQGEVTSARRNPLPPSPSEPPRLKLRYS